MRPELAVLLSSAKLALQDAIEASGLPDDPQLESNLVAMFPAPMQERFVEHIREHRLRRELIATDLANRIVNRLGFVHAFELAEEEGAVEEGEAGDGEEPEALLLEDVELLTEEPPSPEDIEEEKLCKFHHAAS